METYLLNVNNKLRYKIYQYLCKPGINNKIFNDIKNITLFTSITANSILIIGDNYHSEDYSQLLAELNAISNTPIIFVSD